MSKRSLSLLLVGVIALQALSTPCGAAAPPDGTPAAPAQVPSMDCQALLDQTLEVSFLSFLKAFVTARGNIHGLVGRLEKNYDGLNFRVQIPFSSRRVFIFQERNPIATVMRMDARLPYVNKNFDLSHGHFHSINSVDTTDELWKDLHADLQDIFRTKKIAPLMDKYKYLLLEQETFNLNEKLEEFFLRVWAEYSFGPTEHESFVKTRKRLIDVLGAVFHKNRFNRIPFIGRWTSIWNQKRFADELKAVDIELATILRSSIDNKEGAFYELYEKLRQKYSNAFEITLDNSFLGILVYDFIYIVTLDALVHLAQNPDVDRDQQFKQSRHDGFLYPFRFREIAADFDIFRAGDLCVVNLQKAGLYFSSGPRVCVGAALFGDITRKLSEFLAERELCLVHPEEPITKNDNLDLPFMTSSHDVKVRRCPFNGKTN